MSAWVESRPQPAHEWRLPTDVAEVVEELQLCGVPLNADPKLARCLLETNGVWAPRARVVAALRVRRERVLSTVSTVPGQDT